MSEEIKVGSKVVIYNRHRDREIGNVVRETKLYWFVGVHEEKFRKSDLRAPGSDIWSSTTISLATPEKIAEIKNDRLIKSLRMKVRQFDLNALSLDDLQVISDVLDKYRK